MSFRRKVEKKLRRKEKLYEINRLMKEKIGDEYKVFEEVFDRSTLMTIYEFLNKRTIDEIYGVVKSGKEARVYWGTDTDGRELAIKIYLTVTSEFRKGMLLYIEGDSRFTHVRHTTRSLVYAWAKKEYKNLQRAYAAGVDVPKSIAVNKNVLIMNFIGKKGVTAPLIKEIQLEKPLLTFKQILDNAIKLYQKAGLVHADLSEYNIMIWKGKPVLFDLSQSVLLGHPMADKFLRRDIKNIHRYFRKLGVDTPSLEMIYKRVTGVES